MSPRTRKLAVAAVAICCMLLIAALMLYRASQRVPSFYETAVTARPAAERALGNEFERHALELHNQVRRPGHWEMEVTAEQLNGWLAADLPRKFPDLMPPDLLDPRVAIEEDRLLFACRYQGTRMSTVISLTVEVGLTDELNTVALRLVKARAGLLPLPLNRVLDQIRTVAQQTDLRLRWAQQDGDPVALLTVTSAQDERSKKPIVLEVLKLVPDRILLSGHTEDSSPAALESQ